MSKLIKLTEKDLSKLLEKVLREQEMSALEEYMMTIEQIASDFTHETNEEELDFIFDDIKHILESAEHDLQDEELEELYDFANDLVREIEFEFNRRDYISESERESPNYMFFSNLEQIKRQCQLLLNLDPRKIDDILMNGHDWADDHITVAKENMDQVFDFMMNETKRDDIGSQENEFSFDSNISEGRKKTGTKLCARGKAAAKAKFKVYPSAYANGYAVQVCKGRMPGTDGKKHCSGAYC
jgi:hypothetical protein